MLTADSHDDIIHGKGNSGDAHAMTTVVIDGVEVDVKHGAVRVSGDGGGGPLPAPDDLGHSSLRRPC